MRIRILELIRIQGSAAVIDIWDFPAHYQCFGSVSFVYWSPDPFREIWILLWIRIWPKIEKILTCSILFFSRKKIKLKKRLCNLKRIHTALHCLHLEQGRRQKNKAGKSIDIFQMPFLCISLGSEPLIALLVRYGSASLEGEDRCMYCSGWPVVQGHDFLVPC